MDGHIQDDKYRVVDNIIYYRAKIYVVYEYTCNVPQFRHKKNKILLRDIIPKFLTTTFNKINNPFISIVKLWYLFKL
jgi:hypothetical protein